MLTLNNKVVPELTKAIEIQERLNNERIKLSTKMKKECTLPVKLQSLVVTFKSGYITCKQFVSLKENENQSSAKDFHTIRSAGSVTRLA